MTNSGGSDDWWKQYGQGVGSGGEQQGGVAGYPVDGSDYPPPNPYTPPEYPAAPQNPYAAPDYSAYPPPAPAYQGYAQAPPQPGYQAYPQYGAYGQFPPPPSTNGLAIGSLIASIAGLFSCGLGSIVGLVLGVIALNQIKQTGQQGKGLAISGIVVGGVIVAFVLLYFVVVGVTYNYR